ncbi:hyaluronan mediated motility receptor-like [Zophobas morio]|uniref:hyaluronan mediated motility receptor-like n=1 Tax=Zophobas morio TaxID=2755281 RepID=UPI003082F61D
MSFSKAKIQRFNDITACTPSPAKYNVSTQEKIKLGLIAKPGTYVKKPGSPPSSEPGSVHSTPCFQTPSLPQKRKKLLGMSFKSSKSEKLSDHEELRERIVECNNKDLYIKDLTEQIEEMTAKLNHLKTEYSRLENEKNEYEGTITTLQEQHKEDSLRRAKEYKEISNNVVEMNIALKQIRRQHEDLKSENVVDLSKLLANVGKFQELYEKTVEASREELDGKVREFRQKEEESQKRVEEAETRVKQHEEQQEQFLKRVMELEAQLEEIEHLKIQHGHEKEEILKKLDASEAKVLLLEDNLKDVNVLTELQMNEKVQEVEARWRQKLENKEKESEAILKECQEISEYNIIQCEIEKNQAMTKLEETEKCLQDAVAKIEKLEQEIGTLKTEKHAYELSITTFKVTIEVLKKRLISSDRDVEQLKEELEKSEEKNLNYERRCTELSSQLMETETANEELEMQYESTSKLIHKEVKIVENELLRKVELLKEQVQKLSKDKELLSEVLQQHYEQQVLINEAQATIAQSASFIESQEKKQVELETERKLYQVKADEEAEEAAEIRKKYIEKSGKYDELAQQFEQILQELDQARAKIAELEKLIGPYQEQLEAYQHELKLLTDEKSTIENEAKELGLKYAQILGHQNHQQKIKHVKDLKVKSSELFQKNLDLESKNYKLNKMVEKLMKEVDDLRKPGKKMSLRGEDKENMGSPKLVKGIQSPGPLKDKN